jgi:predicted exporter
MDIRNPIGLLFTLLGILLTGAGLFGDDTATKAKTIAEVININLWWGLVLLVFGVGMLVLAFRARRKE